MRVYRSLFAGRRVTPNVLTMCGLCVSVAASFFAAAGSRLFVAGLLLILAGFFDLLDGAVARNANMVTRFGGFLDSVLDRYSDLLVMFGVSVHFLRVSDPLFSVATFFAAIGVAIIPYARARAEAAALECHNGILERPERVLLLVIGLLFGGITLKVVVIILAVLTHVTVFQRVWHVRKESLENSK
jgi:CDP-diacylglycerol---glycerol-3-phosphate 3-phosphatidyltransferase